MQVMSPQLKLQGILGLRRKNQLLKLVTLLLAAAVTFLIVLSFGRRHQPIRDPSSMVPRLLHFVSQTEMLPAELGPLMNSCISLNPGWTAHLWTDQDVRELLLRRWPSLLRLYSESLTQAERQVLTRYPVLYSMGGVFLDPSVECLKPLDAALEAANWATFLALERPENHMILENRQQFKLTQAAMGSPAGAAWFQHAVDVLQRRRSLRDDFSLDEGFLTDCHQLWQQQQQQQQSSAPGLERYQPELGVRLLPWEYFAPNLRHPETILRLCQQLAEWPGLAAVFTSRWKACNGLLSTDTRTLNFSAIKQPGLDAVGVRHDVAGKPRPPVTAGWLNELVFNASMTWPLIRRFSKMMSSRAAAASTGTRAQH